MAPEVLTLPSGGISVYMLESRRNNNIQDGGWNVNRTMMKIIIIIQPSLRNPPRHESSYVSIKQLY